MRSLFAQPVADRRGITLLEVLISMFVLAVGILSILALFTAGRELEARAAVKSRALAFAASQKQTSGTQWLEWRQWLAVANPAALNSFRWAKPDPAPAVAPPIVLPVLIDPWGLCADATVRAAGQQPWDSGVYWDWSRFAPLSSGTSSADPFQRLTVPKTERTDLSATSPLILPFTREAALASFSDEDSIEYQLAPNGEDPPLNAFEVGRRKRGSDLVPALFIAATVPANNTVASGTPVKRSLLIFHRPVPDFESDLTNSWPSGVVELRVTLNQTGLILAQLSKQPVDPTVVRRSLRPGKWMLFTNQVPRPGGGFNYDCEWREVTSVTQDTDGSWLIVPKTDLPSVDWSLYPIYCYAFEHLVHVEQLDNTVLP